MTKDMSNAPKGATAGAPDVTLRLTSGLLYHLDGVAAGTASALPISLSEMARLAAARIRELEAEREKLIEGFQLIEVDLEAGDLPPRIRLPLALRRVKAWIKRNTSAVQVAEGSREAALHPIVSPTKEGK